MKRCNCPVYHVPSADPNDSKGCPLHDPNYVDHEEILYQKRAEEAEHDQAYRVAFRVCMQRYGQMAVATHPDIAEFVEEFYSKIPDHPLMKLNRWLGYIQGVLIERGCTTVEAERDFTRPLFRPLDFGGNDNA